MRTFGPTVAVDDLNLEIGAGQVHALLGENGAGKSTAALVAAGVIEPTSGSIEVAGQPVIFDSPRDAEENGVVLIPQELQLFGPLSVAENLYVGRRRPRNRLGLVSARAMRKSASTILGRLGLEIDVRRPVELLSPASRQLVAIARALIIEAQVLIMDEPTASLDDWESGRLLHIIEELRDSGVAILYVTHRLAEVRQIGDRVTVMRDGRAVAQGDVVGFSDADLVHQMVGRDVETLGRRTSVATDRVVLSVSQLTGHTAFRDISFELREGEVLGIAGLVGAGRTQLVESIVGAHPLASGKITIAGSAVSPSHVGEAVASGLAYVPGERQSEGLFLPMPATINSAFVVANRFARRWLLDERTEREFAMETMAPLDVKGRLDGPVSSLSGGNQQKVLLAKWLATKPRVLILNEPTRGVDVGVRAEIYRIIDDLARDGVAVILVSSEISEIQMLSDRVLVMRQGDLVAELSGDASGVEIGRAVLGQSEES